MGLWVADNRRENKKVCFTIIKQLKAFDHSFVSTSMLSYSQRFGGGNNIL